MEFKAKIFEVFKTFSNEDYTKFGQFVDSDYFNNSEMLRKLYVIIAKKISSQKSISREYLFEKLYPGKEYREGTIVNLLSGLYKLSEDYIAFETYKQESMARDRYLLKGLGSRRLSKFFLRNYELAVNELNKSIIHDEDYFYNRFEIDATYISFIPSESAYIKTEIIQGCHDKLVDFMLVKTLAIYIFMLNNKKYGYDHSFNMSFMETVIGYINENSFENNPAILINYNLMMLLKEDDEQYYFKLKELLLTHDHILVNSAKWPVYICMANFCEVRLDAGLSNEKFARELYELYRNIIEKGIYKIETWYPHLHHRLYINMVQNGLQQKELAWSENFMEVYKTELSEEYRIDTYNLCRALHYFSLKEFEKSLHYVNKVQYDDPFYFLQIKSLALQIYYELGLYDTMASAIDSYKHYLKEKTEIPDRYKNKHKNFIAIVNKMLKAKSRNDNEQARFDVTKDDFKNILKKDWLLEKIGEVEKA